MGHLRSKLRKVYHNYLPDRLKPYVVHLAREIASTIEQFDKKPARVNIETNTICTRICKYCPKDPEEKVTLESEVINSVIDQLADWDFKGSFAPVGYNEPLTDERLTEIIQYARKKLPDAHIMITTNGDLLYEKILDHLVGQGLDEIRISMHEDSDRLRELNAKYDTVSLVDMRDGFRSHPLNSKGGLIKFENAEHLPSCYFSNGLYIRADGNVTICCHDYSKSQIVGNVVVDKIKDIWEKPEFVNKRLEVYNGKFTLDVCKKCEYEVI